MRIRALALIVLCSACHSTNQEWPTWPAEGGPIIVSRPAQDVAVYYIDLKPGFDQVTYAKAISKRVKGRIGMVYQNFSAFTIYDISEADLEKIRQMPEVQSVRKSAIGHVAVI